MSSWICRLTSWGVCNAPWTEVMCQIAFMEPRGQWEEVAEKHNTSRTPLADYLNGNAPSIQPRSQAHWILSGLSICSDYWVGLTRAHAQKPIGVMVILKHITFRAISDHIMVKGSLMPIKVWNGKGGQGDWLAKAGTILSVLPLSLFHWPYSPRGGNGCYSCICLLFRHW